MQTDSADVNSLIAHFS